MDLIINTHLVWLRNDLRIHDNTALYAACQDKYARVLAIFIATPCQWRTHNMSPYQAWFIRNNLQLLAHSLESRGIIFYYFQCANFTDQIQILLSFSYKQKVKHLFYNYQYEENERVRDIKVEQLLTSKTICHGYHDSVLLPPNSVQTYNKSMFRMFTPFKNAFLKRLGEYSPICWPAPGPRGAPIITPCVIDPFNYPCIKPCESLYVTGEHGGLSLLKNFCYQQVNNYEDKRDIPALKSTSRLSAWLAIGLLSPRQCYQQLLITHPMVLIERSGGAFIWLSELIWRDFYRHLLVAWPHLCRYQPFIPWTKNITWQNDKNLFNDWCAGRTGFPIIDAAMRQLKTTGWMHNRLRMITASFLVKDLLIDWRFGEKFFMSNLIDGDLAANNGGWQWVASTGSDSVPYFRIFNPTIQGKRFDPDGKFIRRWLPELDKVPIHSLYQPHSWLIEQEKSRIIDYPAPIIDHHQARKRALASYSRAKIGTAK